MFRLEFEWLVVRFTFDTYLRSPQIDPLITPDHVAQSIVDDFKLSPSYHSVVSKLISEQLSDFRSHLGDDLAVNEGEPMGGAIEEVEEVGWWERWRKRLRTESG